MDPVATRVSGKFAAEDLLAPDHDEELLREQALQEQQRPKGDPFDILGVSNVDKMSFFLLKWVFNAIKRESSDDDPKFQGKPYVSQADLVKQLAKNPELMHALGYADSHQLADAVKLSTSKKEGYLMWSEFLDFFFLKGATLPPTLEKRTDWWTQLDSRGQQIQEEPDADGAGLGEDGQHADDEDQDNLNAANTSGASGGALGGPMQYKSDMDHRPVPMTRSLQVLQSTRASKTEKEVEEEFKALAAEKKGTSKAQATEKQTAKKLPEYEGLETEIAGEAFGFGREKSKNLLLSS